jgi:hypothetical protein
MNNKYKELYAYLSDNNMTDLDENSFYNEYSQNDEKFSKLYSNLKGNNMTDLDSETFKLEYFGTPIIKKKSQVESTESGLEDGSLEPSSTTTTGQLGSSASGEPTYKTNTKDGIKTEVSTNKEGVKTVKVTNPDGKVFVKVTNPDGKEYNKTIDAPKKNKPEIFTGYPGKEQNEYEFKESDGVAHWYEPNPKKDKALTELNSMRNAPPKPGPTGQGSMPAFSPEAIKIKENEYNKIPSKKIIEDDARVRALNKQFGKNASLDPIDQVYTNYDEEKKDNEYRVNDNNWQRKVPGAKSWTTVTDEGAVNALNRRYGKEVKYKAELKSVKPEPKLKFADVNTSLVSKTEEDAVGTLSKKYGKYGFTFEQSGYGTDYIVAYNNDKTKEITVGFDEANPEEALKLKNFLEQNALKENSSTYNNIQNKKETETDYYKYISSDEYKNDFKSLSYDDMDKELNTRIGFISKTGDPEKRKERIDSLYESNIYKIFKEKKKEEFSARDERIDLLYTELQSAKSPADIKNIKSKITAYLTEDVIQDQVKNYSIQLNDLDKSAKILASDQKKYLQSVDDFNKLSQSGKMTQEEFDLAKKNLEDQAEKLGTRADFLMSSGKSIQNDQKKLNVVAGKYVTEKEKAGSFGGGILNSLIIGTEKILGELNPKKLILGIFEEDYKKYSYDRLAPEEKQYYKDKGYSSDDVKNIMVNDKLKEIKNKSKESLIKSLGADQTTQEYMKSGDRGLFAKAIFGVAESAPAMLMGLGGYAASFTGLAAQAYSSIEDEMLNDADFETSSGRERALVAVPYAVLMGVLENFGLKNVVKGSSFTGGIVKDILINSMKQMPKDGTKGLLQNIMTKEVKSVLAKGAFKIVNGAIAEFETGATQALVLDIGLKSVSNLISQSGMTEEEISNLSGGEMFATPDTLGELTSTVLEDGLAEAIGGATMSTFTTVATGLKNGNISLYNEDDLNYLKEISQDTEFKKIIVANLKTEMLKGNLTKSEAQERLDAMNQLSSVIESIPDGLSEKDQISAVNILSEKNRLEKERQGKDPALVTAQTDRINEINEELKNISKNATKEDNIKQQEGTAEGGISEYQGTGEGQQKDGISQGGQRETTINEADSGDSTVASKIQQEEQVATLRAEEQAELLKAIPKIESYKVNGEIDKTLMPKTVLAKYNKIYDKYDKLISPLLETVVKAEATPGTRAVVSGIEIVYPTEEQKAERTEDRSTSQFVEEASNDLPVEDINILSEELGGEFGILTAENPLAQPLTDQENKSLNQKAVEWLESRGYNPRRVTGKYDQGENSFFVPNLSKEDAIAFAIEFNQESVAHSEGLVYQDGSMNPRDKSGDDFSFSEYNPESNLVSVIKTPDGLKTFSIGYNFENKTPASKEGPTVEQEVEAIGQLLSGTDAQIDQKASMIVNKKLSKAVSRAAKALSKIIPGTKFIVHDTDESYRAATKEEGLKQSSNGEFNAKTNTIHINGTSANARTVAHEVFHAILINKVKTDANAAAITKRMVQAIASKIDNNPELKKKLENFISNYEENIQNEEKLAELVGMLSENYNSMSASIKDIIARWIDKLANIFGLDPFNRNETYDMLNTIARKVAKGEVISEADVKTISYKKDVELNAEVRKSLSEQDSIKIAKEVVDKTIKGKSIPTWVQKKTSNKVKFVSFSGEINQKNVKENAPSSYNSIAAKLSNYNTFNINVKEELNNSLAGASKESINKALEHNKKKLLPKINSLLKEIVKIKSNKKLTKEEKLSKISIRNEAIVNIKKIAKMKDLNDQLDAVLNIEHKSTKDSLYNSMFYDLSTNLKRLKGLELANKSEDIYKKAKDIVKSNLLSVYNSVSPRIRQISKLWYDGANLIAQDMANSYELTNEQAAAIIATQSPQMPWFDNLHLADVIMNLMHSESNNIFTKELFDYYVSKSEGYAEQKKYIPTLSKAIGTPLSKLSDLDAAIFIRAYYDTKLSRKAPIRIPTGTAISEDQKGDSSFSGYSVIAKGISIFRDGSIENISNQLGEANKVRNFYMNIADPSDKRAVTIDTHAMAIALFKPLASNDYEVNFDAATFAFYADAYRELADELGIEARALQSITWEAARAIFPAKEKAKSGYKEKISNIWDELVSGNKSLYKVQEEIFNQAQDPNITEWSEYINILKDEKARTNVSGRIVGLEGAGATDNMGAVPGTSIGKSKPSGRTGVSSRGAKVTPRKQLAPNGKPSNLNDVQWGQVRTPAFKKWFGDWENDPQNASKVVDENGEPKVKWRGDNNPKNVFDYINYGGHGVYYFGDVGFAESFGDKLRTYFINCRNPFLPNKTTEKQEKEIRNLLEKDANKILTEIIENNGFKNLYDFLDNYYLIEEGFNENSNPLDILLHQLKNGINYFILEMNPIIEWIKNNNYDGYESYEGNYDNIAVFNSNQIKLADGTNTTFDSAEASIRKQLSPEVSSKLTEDNSGNFVFHHYSNEKRDVIKPGTGENIITGKEEGGALSAVGGLAMYYTMDNQVEPGVGNVLNTVLVPNGKVYDFNGDPDNFYDEAKKRFEATRPSQSFSPNYQLAFITQVANENGYDMVVAKWRNNELRAQTTMSLEASKDNVSMKPIAEETYKVGDNVEVYGSKGRITSIDGEIITFKGDGVGGQINFKRFPKNISKQITPRKQIAEEVTGIEESISPRKQQPMNINDIVRLTKAQGFSDAAIRQYLKDQGYSDKNINDAMEPDTGDVTVSKIREASKKELLSRKKKMTIIDRIRFIRNKIIDRQSDIKRLIKGIGSKESIRAYNLLVSKAGASGFANYRFKNAEADIYKGLSKNDLDTLEDIIYARRMVAINESRAKKGLEPYTGMDGYSEVKALKDLDAIKNKIGEKKFNDLSKRATIYFGVFSENLKKLYESGRINEETYINLRDIEYSPIKTIKYIIGYNLDAETIDKEASKLGVSKKDILALTDSNENAIIFDSKWLLLLNVMSVEGRAFENKMLNEFSDAIDGATQEQRDAISEFIIDNPIVKQTSTGSIQYKYNQNNVPVGYSIVSFFKNGVKKDLVVKEAYATQLLDIKSSNQGLNLIGTLTGAKILRFFATGGNPLFIIGNTAVDFQNILFFSDVYSKFKLFGGAQLSYDFVRKFLKGVSTSNRKNKIYNEYVEHGGAMDFLSNDGLRALKSLSPKNKILNISQKVLIGYGNIMSYLGEKSELAFRLAVYDKVKGDEISKFKKENGRDPDAKELDDIMYEATRNARETMDFNQGGSWVKAADNVMPYLNASMQGFRRPLEYAKNNPLGFTSSLVQASIMAGSVAALSLAALIRSVGDDDEEKKKVLDVLDSLSDYEKATHHIIFTGKKDKDGEYEYYRIKKLPVLSVMSTITEQFTYKYLLSEAGIKYDVDQEVINKSISASTPFTPSDIASRNPLISGLLTYSFNWDSFTGEKIFREPRDKKIAATAEGMYDDKVDQIYKEIAPSLGLSPIRTKAAIEKIVTSENTNPMISIFYASANGFFNKDGYGAEFSDAFSNVFDASARKLKRFTNKDNIRYKEEDNIENREMIIETDIYNKEQKVYNTIKNTYKDGKELSNGELVDLINTNFEKKDYKKYAKKYYAYIKNMNIDRSILDILYEETPEVQALRLYNRYGSELDSEEIKILSGVISKAGMGLSKQAIYIYDKKYSNRK